MRGKAWCPIFGKHFTKNLVKFIHFRYFNWLSFQKTSLSGCGIIEGLLTAYAWFLFISLKNNKKT